MIGNLVGAGAAFTAAIVAARVLDLDQFAAFGVGLAVNSLVVQLGDFGLGTVAIAERADASSQANAHAKAKELALYRARTSAVVSAVAVGVTFVLPSLAPYRDAAVIGAGGAVLGGMTLFFVWSLQGERRFLAAGSLQATQGLLRLALVGACAIAGLGAAPMMVGYAVIAPAVAGILGAIALLARPVPALAEGEDPELEHQVDVSRRRTFAGAGVFAALLLNGDVLLLTVLADAHQVAVYAAAWRFGAGMLLINTAVASALLPFILAADDAWAETKKLVRLGLLVTAGWAVLVPLIVFLGPLILGSVGEEAKEPLTLLAIAFAIDGFYFVLYQIYVRVRRESMVLALAVVEFAVMAIVTLILHDHGALAPAWGQLVARVVVVAVGVTPVVLAALGRCDWFDATS